MSRSWTPQEQSLANKYIMETHGRSMRDQQFYMIKPNGEQIPMQCKQEQALRKKYTELGFLFDNLYIVYKKLSKHPKYTARVLEDIENRLAKYVKYNKCEDEKDTIWLWYIGKLDTGFYYNTYNNQLLEEYIISEVKKLIK